MKHRVALKKLNKMPAHRKAMMRNMLVSLYKYERIKTSCAKAKALRPMAEKLITRAKDDTVHNRRMAARWIQDKEILNKLFKDIAPKYKARDGGYTRIVKIGPRYGDASEMAFIALVGQDEQKKESVAQSKKVSDSKSKTQKEKSVASKGKVHKDEAVSTVNVRQNEISQQKGKEHVVDNSEEEEEDSQNEPQESKES